MYGGYMQEYKYWKTVGHCIYTVVNTIPFGHVQIAAHLLLYFFRSLWLPVLRRSLRVDPRVLCFRTRGLTLLTLCNPYE